MSKLELPCPNCGKRMTAFREACPHCTHTTTPGTGSDWLNYAIAIFIIYILFSAFG